MTKEGRKSASEKYEMASCVLSDCMWSINCPRLCVRNVWASGQNMPHHISPCAIMTKENRGGVWWIWFYICLSPSEKPHKTTTSKYPLTSLCVCLHGTACSHVFMVFKALYTFTLCWLWIWGICWTIHVSIAFTFQQLPMYYCFVCWQRVCYGCAWVRTTVAGANVKELHSSPGLTD